MMTINKIEYIQMDKQLFNLKFAVKRLERAAARSHRSELSERQKLHSALLSHNPTKARIHAESSIRHRHQSALYLRLSARLDSILHRLHTAASMRAVSDSMRHAVRGMEKALEEERLEEVCRMMGRFEAASETVQVREEALQEATKWDSVVGVEGGGAERDEVRELLQQVADEHGLAVEGALLDVGASLARNEAISNSDALEDRLAKLREL
jgi:charged multivesicular body protein 1